MGHQAKCTVLLVEDEEQVRGVVRAQLLSWGYAVLEAGNFLEAILACKGFEGEIQLLVTDVMVPAPLGGRLAECLVAMRPKLKVIFLSGDSYEWLVERGVLRLGVAFIQKPFSGETLKKKIREVLRGEEGREG